ncbi:response regulator transcription factor [Vibrio hippocampi]|uniref:DNA-binding transcriptional activator EvgA n=1 Tax=Vibrio hippocampi TaxID=654686 RepID=A0ABM8ZN46_9VIBR|nr:response regulator transcription factor [Vibrio hippocampi]CAH0529980.1 DNA-binding transcriptional activator EvgA [Vibrio hippocampi]
MSTFNCLILDDHPLVCVAIKALLTNLPCINSIETEMDASKVTTLIKQHDINLIIVDVNLGDHDGFDLVRRMIARGYKGKVLFFSAESSQMFSEIALKLGADGYVCKSENHSILKDAVEGIANGYSFFKFVPTRSTQQQTQSLSQRETAVMNYLLQGKSNREVAAILSISDKTVSTYKKRIMDKYAVSNLLELSKVTARQ